MSKFASTLACIAIGVILTLAIITVIDQLRVDQRATIGATANIVEVSSGVSLLARVDTGARATSLHYEEGDLIIEDESSIPEDNVGKPARLRIENSAGKFAWVDARIDSHIPVRTADSTEFRYGVILSLQHEGIEQPTLVTLNDRSSMRYRMLIGRNFLDRNFVVDVTVNGHDEF